MNNLRVNKSLFQINPFFALIAKAEARRVATPAFRQQIAESIAAGIRDYAATLDALRPK